MVFAEWGDSRCMKQWSCYIWLSFFFRDTACNIFWAAFWKAAGRAGGMVCVWQFCIRRDCMEYRRCFIRLPSQDTMIIGRLCGKWHCHSAFYLFSPSAFIRRFAPFRFFLSQLFRRWQISAGMPQLFCWRSWETASLIYGTVV